MNDPAKFREQLNTVFRVDARGKTDTEESESTEKTSHREHKDTENLCVSVADSPSVSSCSLCELLWRGLR